MIWICNANGTEINLKCPIFQRSYDERKRWHAFWWCCLRQTFAFRWSIQFIYVIHTNHVDRNWMDKVHFCEQTILNILWKSIDMYSRYYDADVRKCAYMCHLRINATIEHHFVGCVWMLWCDESVCASLFVCHMVCRHLWDFVHVFIFKMKC